MIDANSNQKRLNDEKNKLIEIDSKYYETEKKSDKDLEVAKINLTNEQEKIDMLLSSLSAGKVVEHKNSLEDMRKTLQEAIYCIDKIIFNKRGKFKQYQCEFIIHNSKNIQC